MSPFSPSMTASRFHAWAGKLSTTSLTIRALGASLTTRRARRGRPPVCAFGSSTPGRSVHMREGGRLVWHQNDAVLWHTHWSSLAVHLPCKPAPLALWQHALL